MSQDSKYIHHSVVTTFRGNQSYTLAHNEYSVREDDTTTIYKKDTKQTMPEVKRILKRYAGEKGGVVTLEGSFPRYYLDTQY